jgi:hypothetical protein
MKGWFIRRGCKYYVPGVRLTLCIRHWNKQAAVPKEWFVTWHSSCKAFRQLRCVFPHADFSELSYGLGDAMRRRRVDEILQPYEEGVPLDPCVEMGGRIIDAIELMVKNNVKCLAVTINKRPVGIVRLKDAFEEVGLQVRNQ